MAFVVVGVQSAVMTTLELHAAVRSAVRLSAGVPHAATWRAPQAVEWLTAMWGPVVSKVATQSVVLQHVVSMPAGVQCAMASIT